MDEDNEVGSERCMSEVDGITDNRAHVVGVGASSVGRGAGEGAEGMG